MYFKLPGIWPETMSFQIRGNKSDDLLMQEQFQLRSKLPKLKHKHCRICRLNDLLFRLLFSFTLPLFVLFLLSLFHISVFLFFLFVLLCFPLRKKTSVEQRKMFLNSKRTYFKMLRVNVNSLPWTCIFVKSAIR